MKIAVVGLLAVAGVVSAQEKYTEQLSAVNSAVMKLQEGGPSFCSKDEYEEFQQCFDFTLEYEDLAGIDTPEEFCGLVGGVIGQSLACLEDACNAKCDDNKEEFQGALDLIGGLFNCSFGDACKLAAANDASNIATVTFIGVTAIVAGVLNMINRN